MEKDPELKEIQDELVAGHKHSLSHSLNHLIHDQLDRMHDTTADLLDADDQNDANCIKLLQQQSQELFKLLQIRMNL